jgi:ribosomal protein S18 acetylase RimI-like enzyme
MARPLAKLPTVNDILIREATSSDLPAIAELLEELAGVVDEEEGIDAGAACRNCADLLNDARSHVLLADINGNVAGMVHFTVRQTMLHGSPSGLIDELIVRREYQGRGTGRELVAAAIRKCRELGCCEVEVSTEKTNRKALEFYRKCGFEERGVLLEADL